MLISTSCREWFQGKEKRVFIIINFIITTKKIQYTFYPYYWYKLRICHKYVNWYIDQFLDLTMSSIQFLFMLFRGIQSFKHFNNLYSHESLSSFCSGTKSYMPIRNCDQLNKLATVIHLIYALRQLSPKSL